MAVKATRGYGRAAIPRAGAGGYARRAGYRRQAGKITPGSDFGLIDQFGAGRQFEQGLNRPGFVGGGLI